MNDIILNWKKLKKFISSEKSGNENNKKKGRKRDIQRLKERIERETDDN